MSSSSLELGSARTARSAFSPAFLSHARAPHCVAEYLEHILPPCRGRGRPTGDDPRHRSTMHGSGRLPELLGPCHGHHWVRVSVGSTLVTLAGRRPHRWRALAADDLLCFGSADGWGPADPRGPLSVPVCVRACSDPGAPSVFTGWF